MVDEPRKKRRRTMSLGIKYGNIVMTGILVIGGLQYESLEKIKEDVGSIRTDTTVNRHAIINQGDMHKKDYAYTVSKIRNVSIRVSKIENIFYEKYGHSPIKEDH